MFESEVIAEDYIIKAKLRTMCHRQDIISQIYTIL